MPSEPRLIERSVEIPPVGLAADVRIPASAKGFVLFAHGSGSSRLSSRNRFVASVLNQAGFATLLLDLLTAAEEKIDGRTMQLRFDVGLLATRLVQATEWASEEDTLSALAPAYFGASTGAAGALIAAAELPQRTWNAHHGHKTPCARIRAVVSRGGRPDLAGPALGRVKAPTLLIVGGDDVPVIQLNEKAFVQLLCEKKLEIVAGATHLFEELGTLEQVAMLASAWFGRYLA